MRSTAWAVFSALLVLTAGCGSGGSASSATKPPSNTSSGQPTAPKETVAPSTSIVGRWEQVHTCAELVTALHRAGLAPLAAGVVGDYFPGRTPQQLAGRADICKGAAPQRHSHFFNKSGAFGSLDQHGSQVDDGTFHAVDNRTIRIGTAEFRYRIVGGRMLMLHPVIRASDRRQALASPLKFSTAGWQIAVSYGGLPWRRVPCANWC